MSTHLVLIPSIYKPYTEECVASLSPEFELLIVDNTQHNRGVAASWNLGRERVLVEGLDWLIVCSAAVRFGTPMGSDLLAELEQHSGARVVEGAWGLGWHLICFSRRVLEEVGSFDENFWPAYFEDNDWSWRFHLVYATQPPYWEKVTVDAWVRSFAHAERFAGVRAYAPGLLDYYRAKWSGVPGQERFAHPFNDSSKSLAWWPTSPDPRALTR